MFVILLFQFYIIIFIIFIIYRIEIKQSDSALSPQFELNMKFINFKKIIKKNKTDTSTGEIEV